MASLAIAVATLLVGLPACSSGDLCRAASEACPCPKALESDSALVVLTDQASPAFVEAIQRITMPNSAVFKDDRIGFSSPPTVILATYDATGTVTVIDAFNLAGDGQTQTRKEAAAALASSCLSQAPATIPADAPAGNLLRALPVAADLASIRGKREAAVLAFGLGRSSLDDQTMDQELPMDRIDFSTTEAQTHVIDVLRHIGLLPLADGVVVTLVDPDESVANAVTAGYINQFAEGPLCDAIETDRCQVLAVLP